MLAVPSAPMVPRVYPDQPGFCSVVCDPVDEVHVLHQAGELLVAFKLSKAHPCDAVAFSLRVRGSVAAKCAADAHGRVLSVVGSCEDVISAEKIVAERVLFVFFALGTVGSPEVLVGVRTAL